MRLFVYGTLLTASDTAPARRLRRRTIAARPAHIAGRLYAVRTPHGWFPALMRGRRGEQVTGMLCDLALGVADLGWLDRYEGAEYRRRPTPAIVTSPAGAACQIGRAQVYRWQARLPPGALRVRSGDFLAWLASTGHAAYDATGRTTFSRRSRIRVQRPRAVVRGMQ